MRLNIRQIRTSLLVAGILAGLALPVFACGSASEGDGGNAVVETMEAGLPQIELLGPRAAGAGEVPAFEWKSVTDASLYRLVVKDADGEVLWAWSGTGTKVNLGGLPDERPADISGPVVTPGSTWSVVAFGGSGEAVAVSDIRAVSP